MENPFKLNIAARDVIGREIPFRYGHAYSDPKRNSEVYYIVPLNLIIKFLRFINYAYCVIRFHRFDYEGKIVVDYYKIRETTEKMSFQEGWKAGYNTGLKEIGKKPFIA